MSTFEKLMTDPSAIARHQAATLAKEREAFLNHLSASGLTPSYVRQPQVLFCKFHDDGDQGVKRFKDFSLFTF